MSCDLCILVVELYSVTDNSYSQNPMENLVNGIKLYEIFT